MARQERTTDKAVLYQVGIYLLLILGWISIVAVLSPKAPGERRVLEFAILAVVLTILFRTAAYWGRFIGGFVALRVGIALAIRVISGQMPHARGPYISARNAMWLLGFCAALMVLSWPLFRSRRTLNWFDRGCFLAAYAALGASAAGINEPYVWFLLTTCLLLFGVLWQRERADHRKRRRERAERLAAGESRRAARS